MQGGALLRDVIHHNGCIACEVPETLLLNILQGTPYLYAQDTGLGITLDFPVLFQPFMRAAWKRPDQARQAKAARKSAAV
jgi:hypothetical protein